MMKINDVYESHYVVTERVYNSFVETFGDINPVHVDPEVARKKGFRDTLMHGAIMAGFLSNFIGTVLPEENTVEHSCELQFVNPVYLNDKLTLRATVVDYYESVNDYELKYRFYNEAGQVVTRGTLHIGITG
jgi:3-hydroxybutyryl-CoA dehydratase